MTVIFRWALTVQHPPISFGTRGISADLSRSVITDLECELEWLTSGASTRSAHVAAAERLLATRLAERQGHARSRALTFDALAAWYLDDYAVRRLRTLNTARGRVANLRAVFTGWRGTGCARTWRGRRRARRRASDDGRAADQRAAVGDRACGGDPAPQFGGRGPSPACRAPSRPPRGRLWADRLARRCPPRYGRRRRCRATAGTPRDRARGMWSTRPLPFADPDTWQRLRAVIDTVGQWKASVVQIGGRLCWPLWRGVHELDEVLTCFHRRPAGTPGCAHT